MGTGIWNPRQRPGSFQLVKGFIGNIGTNKVAYWLNTKRQIVCEFAVCSGGGGGGVWAGGGGGGGGGVLIGQMNMLVGYSFAMTVGAGGVGGGNGGTATKGSASTISTWASGSQINVVGGIIGANATDVFPQQYYLTNSQQGGGYGGGDNGNPSTGGSGGGAGRGYSASGAAGNVGGPVDPVVGYAGGAADQSGAGVAGGGGGSAQAGQPYASSLVGGAGGDAINLINTNFGIPPFANDNQYVGGGGGGGSHVNNASASGGLGSNGGIWSGGNAGVRAVTAPQNGFGGTGGGGGGASGTAGIAGQTSGNGGGGTILIKFKTANLKGITVTFPFGSATSTTTVGAYTVYRFNSTAVINLA